jgi:tetratricopeptide (TPR) repeat protein
MTDFVIPVSPAFRDTAGGSRSPASSGGADAAGEDSSYRDRSPSASDRDIVGSLPQGLPEDQGKREDIEQGLGLVASDDSVPVRDKSYLASLDYVKQLYRAGRYEAGLLEIDGMIRLYPTDPQLHQMKGTLLDRIGKPELALKSWQQALRFNPKNVSLRHFIERREQRASLGTHS